MKDLLSLTEEQLKNLLADMGEKPYAARQLMSWLKKGVPFDDMTNLSKGLREKLRRDHTEGYAKINEKRVSTDGTEKYLLAISGGGLVECVLMRYHHGDTLCVSTQVGCRMGCVFCASGKHGLVRSLSAGEMRSEFIAVNKDGNVSNVVLMGSGEPLDNYDNAVSFIRALNVQHDIGMRHISLSTCGIVPGILKLADEGMQITLCISLHSAIDEKRKKVMPVAAAYSVRQILDAANIYFKKTGRRIIIEYTLIKDFNDGSEDILTLKDALHGLNCHINVIPLNRASGGYMPPAAKQAHAFAEKLVQAGKSATVRRSLGSDIEGACGQLKLKREEP
ncbi:MAG: 23S rRNA (adenine(2503)-C(2))-methyltransferase RlmN [Eubacteriales bacterium]|nr:23S rRNA (adenine(2503)-C(2))-methyltransferase RlmN [Eubacteriales bacterium]